MNIYGERMLESIATLGISNSNDFSDLYSEMYAISTEINRLRAYLEQIYSDTFITDASEENISLREQLTGGTRSELTLVERKNLLKNRYKLFHKCLNGAALNEIFNALNVSGYYGLGGPGELEISIYAYYPESSCKIIERQLLGLLPAGYNISIEYG